jgi:hypothetical protein
VGRWRLPADVSGAGVEWAVGSDSGLEGDGVAEGFGLADVAAHAAFGSMRAA